MTQFCPRILNLSELLKKKSLFLFGPRGVGKSSLVRESLKEEALVINLLRASYSNQLLRNPSELEEIIDGASGPKKIVVIDEVQKVPALLDEVHRLIEERGIRFLLTGSSARRLKSRGVNLLAGRAWIAHLFPLLYREIGANEFDLNRYLRFGGLPSVWFSEDQLEQLDAYVQTYINEEIKSEGAVRKLPAFVDMLRSAALSNGKIIQYSKIARDAGVSPPTVASYYEILEDTLLGFQLHPWKRSKNRKAIASSKFYFFDPGVVNALAGTEHVERNSPLYGDLFEQFIAIELHAFMSYTRRKDALYFWRTESGIEVDFLIEKHLAIEVKATRKVQREDLKGLQALRLEGAAKHYVFVSQDPVERMVDQIECMPWQSFISRLWQGGWFLPSSRA
jgi:predicted AAA+ superfamily ATPase